MFVECPFCHRKIPQAQYAQHEKQHTTLLEDGQMTDHITVREEDQYQGSLAKVPQVYLHKRCGQQTGMPDEIIRSYLADPFLYNDKSFCTGCNTYVSTKELFWTETGESLFQYNQNLKREHLLKQGIAPQDVKYGADGSVLGGRRSGSGSSAGRVLLGIFIFMMFLGLAGAVVLGGAIWIIAHARPAPAPQPPGRPVGGPVLNFKPDPQPLHPQVNHDPFKDMHEQMRRQREEHQRMRDDMRRQHDEMIRRIRP